MKTGEREYTVDRLRGYALLGIILVNAPFLLTSINGFTNASAPSLGDRIAWFSVAAFFQAKSYVIFSFLFGYSLAIFLRGVERRGEPATRLFDDDPVFRVSRRPGSTPSPPTIAFPSLDDNLPRNSAPSPTGVGIDRPGHDL